MMVASCGRALVRRRLAERSVEDKAWNDRLAYEERPTSPF